MRQTFLALVFSFLSLHAYGAETKPSNIEVKFRPSEQPRSYLYDAIKESPHRKPIISLILRERLPHWVKLIPKNRNYVSTPALVTVSPIDGAVVYNACETRECVNKIEILLTPQKKAAFALLKEGKNLRFVGAPDEKAKAILQAAMAK